MTEIGKIVTTRGLKGELKILPYTNIDDMFDDLENVYINGESYEIEYVKHIKNCVSLKLGGINSPEDAAKYIHKIVSVDNADLKPLEENEYYIGDLRGISVINHDTGEHVGTLKDVLITGGNDVLDIETEDGRQVLVPMVHEFVKNIDVESGRMEIHFIDGMLNGD